MNLRKKALIIGIYDPDLIDFWPWHYHYEHGEYLSEKYRKCGEEKAAKFKKKEEAEKFFFQWKHHEKYKFELIEMSYWEK